MKTRVTVLNSKDNAKFPWPKHGLLYSPKDNGQCCIGQQGRQDAGIPLSHMSNVALPTGVASCGGSVHKWKKLWEQRVPLAVVKEMNKILEHVAGHSTHFSEHIPDMAFALAADLNDHVAVRCRSPDVAVEALRILWRWLGETQGERWIIRWLR